MKHRSYPICSWLPIALALTGSIACGSDQPSAPSGSAGSPGAVVAAGSGAGAPAAAAGGSPAAGTGGAGSGAVIAGAGGTPSAGSSGAAGVSAAGSGGAVAAGSGGSAAGMGGMAAAAGAGGAGGVGGSAGTAGVGPMGGNGGVTPGNGGALNATEVVGAGQTYDGQGKRYTAGSALGDGSQSEDQQPMFKLENGAKLINVVLGAPAADGIHTYGDVTLENIVWEDIGEDALTIKESGTVTLDGGSASKGEDKVFQINAPSTFKVSNFTASDAGKFIRQNGDTTFKVDVVIDRCDISNMDEAIFRTDSNSSTVTMTNTKYSNIGDSLFVGVSAGNITQSGNMEY
jgi:pectate lyase C